MSSRPERHSLLSKRKLLLALLGAATAATVLSFQPAPAAPADSLALTYLHGVARVDIPYQLPRAGDGQLVVEVLDPDDSVLASASERVKIPVAKGQWHEELKFNRDVALDDVAWNRLRYRFTYSSEKTPAAEETDAVAQILRTPVLHILGQSAYLAGAPAAVRVIVTDNRNQPIAGASTLRIELEPFKTRAPLFTGRLDAKGTAEAQFQFPAGAVGGARVRYSVETPIGSAEYVESVRLEDKVGILLTTEKPIYQPGQAVHIRALAQDRANHDASANRAITFEIQDARGNKVFRKAEQTSKFGIASAEFDLADEVNLGAYHLKATLASADANGAANTAEINFNVDRYVLPKFKVAVDFSAADKTVSHGYRPGDHVTGVVRATYFFGKAVDRAEVAVKATGMDVAQFDAGSQEGKTDDSGEFHFDFVLPKYFAGKAMTQGAARVLVEATVKDSAGHAETRGEPIVVSQSPLIVTAIPEGGTLIGGVENQVFVLTSYADGKPAATNIKVTGAGPERDAETDAGGVAVISIHPGLGLQTLQIAAADKQGNKTNTAVTLQIRNGADPILLRAERAVYKPGDRIAMRVFSTKSRGSVYLDIIKNGQTVVTRDLDIVNGQAEFSLVATPAMAGTLDCNAYEFGADATVTGDHRLLFVQPASDLKVEATTDRPVYKPGEDAQIRFKVTDSRGQGVAAALGIQTVDEAVFALAEKQPGFAKVFFYLEQEAMKPRYEIHSFGMSEVVEPPLPGRAEVQNRAARALFAATEMSRPNAFRQDVNPVAFLKSRTAYDARYRAAFENEIKLAAAGITANYRRNHDAAALKRAVKALDARDPWGEKISIEPVTWSKDTYMARSAGPDKRFDTADDFLDYVRLHEDSGPSSIVTGIEPNRGPNTGTGEISGTVIDRASSVIGAAEVRIRNLETQATRTAISNVRGEFTFAALPAGRYAVAVSRPGFDAASSGLTLAPRDRAALRATLGTSVVLDAVTVEQAPVGFARGGGGGGVRMMAMAGGVIGGVAGGVPMPAPSMARAAMNVEVQAQAEMFKDEARRDSFDAAKSMNAPKEPGGGQPEARTRSYFPEALYINPELITDANGAATISIPLADSITTWRMAVTASTVHGALGSGTANIKVFQDFFADLDLPTTLTQGDQVSVPVAIYNYTGARGDVDLSLKPEAWYSLAGDSAAKTLPVDSNHVGGAQFTIRANSIGKFKLTLSAKLAGGNRADIVVREIEVVPDGREMTQVFNGRLEHSADAAIAFPANSIAGASKVLVRLYPGPLSQVIEGMDAILRMPYGCFEQTSSSTYPNVLALDYMKRTKKSTPEIAAKAEGFIAQGYQRLLTFEVPGGGFSWFGNPPANKILTAYGLMEFSDMAKVHEVDAALISRTQQWLVSQQQPDGSWKPDANFINEGATNRFNNDVLRITAYLGWSLANTGYRGPAVDKAKQYVEQHIGDSSAAADSYTLAVLANFAADSPNDHAFLNRAVQALLAAKHEEGEKVWWSSEQTGLYGAGDFAAVETTGLAVQSLLKSGEESTVASKALAYLASKKDANGSWGSTQATIMALRAILLSTEKGAADVRGDVEVALNGQTVQRLTLTPDNNDLFHQFVLANIDAKSDKVSLKFSGKGGLAYQVVGRYFVPWGEKPAGEPLSIDVAYDRTHLAQDDVATATATVKNNLNKAANMVMVDLGIPPGFDLLSEDLQDYVAKSATLKSARLEKFSLTATQAILYFDSIAPGSSFKLSFRLRAKYPIRTRTFESKVYEYYNPDVKAVAKPLAVEVTGRK